MKINTTGIENDINREQARRAYYNISFDPDKRGDSDVSSYIASMLNLAQYIENSAAGDERKEAIAQEVFDRLRSSYKNKMLKWLAAKSRCISSMITGPANFPVRRAEKANNAEHNRAGDLIQFGNAMKGYADKALESVIPKAEKMEDELTAMRGKLAGAEAWQQRMKDANTLLRKGYMDGLRAMLGDDYSAFMKGGWWGKGYAPFELSNNLANIKRMKERVDAMEKRAATPTTEQNAEGVKIVRNAEQDRLQLIFEGKPPEAIRAMLKKNGFKWSPRFGAWQRQLTENAERALNYYVLPALKSQAA